MLLALSVMSFSHLDCKAQTDIELKRQETREKINHLKWLENLETNKLYKNQQKLETTKSSLLTSKKKLYSTQDQLEKLQFELSQAMSDFSALNFQMKRRIRSIYKKQRKEFFNLLLTSKDINAFLDRLYFESIIVKKDYAKMTVARSKATNIARLKYRIESQKRNLNRSIQNINQKQRSIKRAIAKNENMIHKLRTDRGAYERAERELAKQSSSLQTMISKNPEAKNVSVTSSFIKPISGRITSPFGWRTHPIFNSKSFHSGVDIGGQYNYAVRASNSGKCIYSGWYGGYGKVIILDHGKVNGQPVTTLYAHLNSTKVSVGEYVSKGQTVGYEGTTGYSTGPHLHFEVRVNGKPNNPLNYI